MGRGSALCVIHVLAGLRGGEQSQRRARRESTGFSSFQLQLPRGVPKRPKRRESKALKAKVKGRQGPKGQNERNWRLGGARAVRAKTLEFRVSSFDRQCGGDRPRCQSMAATAQLYLGLYVRVL